MGRVVLLLVALALVAGCRESVTTTPSRPRQARTRWLLDPDADDADLFCVDTFVAGDFGVRCTTIKDIRAYVRYQRVAE